MSFEGTFVGLIIWVCLLSIYLMIKQHIQDVASGRLPGDHWDKKTKSWKGSILRDQDGD